MTISPGPLYLIHRDTSDPVDRDLPPLPAGTPRCDCGLALQPLSGLCAVCDLKADEPIQVIDEPLSGDPLDIDRTPF